MSNVKKLYRDPANKMIGGVCAGIADYTGIDTTNVRLAFALLALFSGIGLIAYLILWIVLPEKQ